MTSKHYLNNRDLYEEVVKSQQQGQPTEKLGEMFMLLAERNANHRWFCRYPFREDLISVGTLACIKAYDKFDGERFDNAFAFFTSCIHNALKQYVKKEYDQSNIVDALKIENGLDPSYGYNDSMSEDNHD